MKQPENSIDLLSDTKVSGGYLVDVNSDEGVFGSAEIARGKTKSSALKAAKRRLQRLIRDIERELENES